VLRICRISNGKREPNPASADLRHRRPRPSQRLTSDGNGQGDRTGALALRGSAFRHDSSLAVPRHDEHASCAATPPASGGT
jgi:hypothetical protein